MICGKVIIDDCIKVMTIGLRSIGNWIVDLDFEMRTSGLAIERELRKKEAIITKKEDSQEYSNFRTPPKNCLLHNTLF